MRQGLHRAALLVALGLGACSSHCPPQGLRGAAMYESEVNRKGRILPLPNDQWVRNPGVEAFLRDTLRAEGFASLTGKYGMQCVPRAEPAGCSDCHVCSANFPGTAITMKPALPFLFAPYMTCIDYGEMSVRAEIGPGQTVNATTYQHRPSAKVD